MTSRSEWKPHFAWENELLTLGGKLPVNCSPDLQGGAITKHVLEITAFRGSVYQKAKCNPTHSDVSLLNVPPFEPRYMLNYSRLQLRGFQHSSTGNQNKTSQSLLSICSKSLIEETSPQLCMKWSRVCLSIQVRGTRFDSILTMTILTQSENVQIDYGINRSHTAAKF